MHLQLVVNQAYRIRDGFGADIEFISNLSIGATARDQMDMTISPRVIVRAASGSGDATASPQPRRVQHEVLTIVDSES